MNHHLGATRNFDMELCIPQPQFFHHRQARQIYRFYQLLYYFSRYDFPNWRPAGTTFLLYQGYCRLRNTEISAA